MESKMKKLLVAVGLVVAAFPAVAGALDIGETFTLRVDGQPLSGFNEPFVPLCKNLDDLKTFTLDKLRYNKDHFCMYYTSGMKLKIIYKDGDYLCVQNAGAKYGIVGVTVPLDHCYWMEMSPLDAIGAPRQIF
jgi:hypothetical protein